MGLEIELKAHVRDDEADAVRANLEALDGCRDLGHEAKEDTYWSLTEDGQVRFRTRVEEGVDGKSILVTSKPSKVFSGTEHNIENEFTVPFEERDKLMEFVEGLDLVIIRRKSKEGWHCMVEVDGWDVHCELLKVKYLDGWFLENEICVGSGTSDEAIASAQKALHTLLGMLGVSEDRIETSGYHKMLKAVGHEKG